MANSNPPINGSAGDELFPLVCQIRDSLVRIEHRLAAVEHKISRLMSVSPSADETTPLCDADSTKELVQKLGHARAQGDPYAVLDIRQNLLDRITEEARLEMDRELAGWFTLHFHQALRSGHAAIVAGAMERAVEQLGTLPEMRMLADSLPTILRSVGLYQESRQEDPDDLDA